MKLVKTIFVLLAVSGPVASTMASDTLTIGTNNWSENIAVSNLWQQLLEEKGHEIELTSTGKSVIFSGLAQGDIDISMEVWLPNGDAQYLEPYQEQIDVHDAWFNGAQDELVVPSYMSDINTINDLKENADQFAYQGTPTIIGIESGSAIAGETDDAIERYDLPFRQLSSSGPAMLASLKDAIRRQEPVAVTLWQPHWAYAKYELKALKDPKKAYGGGDDIMWMSTKGFAKQYPDIAAMLNAWDMSHEQLADLMLTIENVGDPQEGAEQWIEEHRELIGQWLSAVE